MAKYRVEVGGETVWEKNVSGDATTKNFPAEYRDRPADPADGEAFPPAHVLYIGDDVVGVQVSLAEEEANTPKEGA